MAKVRIFNQNNTIHVAGKSYPAGTLVASNSGDLITIKRSDNNRDIVRNVNYSRLLNKDGNVWAASAVDTVTALNNYIGSNNPDGVIKSTDKITALTGLSTLDFASGKARQFVYATGVNDGIATTDKVRLTSSLEVVLNDNTTVQGNLSVSGNTTVQGNLSTVGNATLPGIILGATGILGTGQITTTNNIVGNDISAYGNLNVSGSTNFTNGITTPTISFTNNGTSTIGPANTGGVQEDLEIRSNGNITVLLDADTNETGQKFSVHDPSGTERFSVNDSGLSTFNNSFTLPSSDGASGEVLTTDGSGNVSFETLSAEVLTVTSSITLSSTHANKYIVVDSSSAVSITVPASATYDATAEFIFEQYGAGQITIVADTGVTINSTETLKSSEQYAVIGLKRTDTNRYTLTGERELV